jgi:hypothetical protein
VNELGLFAGAGGGLLASRLLGWRTVCAVEIEPYCQRVVAQRQRDGFLEPFPIWDDISVAGAGNSAQVIGENHGNLVRGTKGLWPLSHDPSAGMVDGVANWVDRARAVGNGQVPAVAALAWELLT